MTRTVGIDVGGTAIKHGVVETDGRVIAEGSATSPKGGRAAILNQLVQIVESYTDYGPKGVGIGSAGAVDFETGTIKGHSPNIPDWSGTAIRAELEPRVSLPIFVDNDANCMALGELHCGAGRDCQSILFLTLGTGVGSAFVAEGRLWRGAHSMGGELGHATIVHNGRVCSCGQRGHLEAYASAPALVRRMLELAHQGLPSVYSGSDDAIAAVLGSKEVFAAAESGDAAAAQAISETAAYLGSGIASAINMLDPERVVIGGGMAEAGSAFLGQVTQETAARVHAGVAPYVSIVPAELGNSAGWIGAGLLASAGISGGSP